jgi:Icc-related predicted phosphoesterase
MRIAAVADLHCSDKMVSELKPLLQEACQEADVLVLPGDLTHKGRIDQMQILLDLLAHVSVPIVAVAGNHDHDSDQQETLVAMLTESGIHVLDASACEIGGVEFVGTKGFCGGFGDLAIHPMGERILKRFLNETVEEAARLEKALEKISTRPVVGVLHYSPIKETLEGEPPELYAFLGSSHLASVFDRHDVDLILHGHTHKGSLQGKTERGTPVLNVCRFVLKRYTDRSYALIDL